MDPFTSLEEEELTAQRDAALSLVTGLEEKIRIQGESYEARTEASEVGRVQAELQMSRLLREQGFSRKSVSRQLSAVSLGWLVGVVLGWATALATGYLFSALLGFMLVPPFISLGVACGLGYKRLGEEMGWFGDTEVC
ncbi:unnamed protein product [Discosporangium mesarthrocarpum]